MSLGMALEEIKEANLQRLVDEKIVERKTLEYKKALPDRDDKAKKEFLADVSSFANAGGGHIIYGIEEDNGEPAQLCGLGEINVDDEKLHLENLMRDCLRPRIPRVDIQPVRLTTSGVAVVIRIARSWNGPHAVQHKSESMRFYTRHSAGKKLLDIQEVRAAFIQSETTRERIMSFRAERIGNIMSGEAPFLLPDGGKVALHLLPLSAFDPSISFDPVSFENTPWKALSPIGSSGGSQTYNFDGFLRYTKFSSSEVTGTYVLAFRSGAIEAVEATRLNRESIFLEPFERTIINATRMYLAFQKRIGLQPPVLAMLSLVGVKGRTMQAGNDRGGPERPIDRDVLVLPEILVDDFDADPGKFMKPAFDQIWNACGLEGSYNYNANGKWVGQK